MTSNDDNNQRCGNGGGGSDGGEMISSKKECTSCEQNNVDNITEGIESIVLEIMSTCASCGKEGANNVCNKCKQVKYCNAVCKKVHKKKHKKECDEHIRIATEKHNEELRIAAELHDEALFKEHPPREECPICMQPLPYDEDQVYFESCCGKVICNGCIYAIPMNKGVDLCPYCRTPEAKNDKEIIIRTQKLMDKGNAEAFDMLAGYYTEGDMGLPQDYRKANELYLKAGELGFSGGYFNLGNSYRDGKGVALDMKKARHYYEIAAMNGSIHARNNLGCLEETTGNYHRSMKHLIIAARAGYKLSLETVKKGYKHGFVTKDEYANTLRVYHERQMEMKSDAREKAAALRIMS